jgi:hypothetical protein
MGQGRAITRPPTKNVAGRNLYPYLQVKFRMHTYTHKVLCGYRLPIGSTITYIKATTNRDEEATKT